MFSENYGALSLTVSEISAFIYELAAQLHDLE